MVRYRTRVHGVTRFSVLGLRNLPKIGVAIQVMGYRKKVRRLFESGWTTLTQEFVKVIGEKGTATFTGFLWGYHGEGPRGLVQLLVELGVPQYRAEEIAFNTPRLNTIGTDWLYDINTNKVTTALKEAA